MLAAVVALTPILATAQESSDGRRYGAAWLACVTQEGLRIARTTGRDEPAGAIAKVALILCPKERVVAIAYLVDERPNRKIKASAYADVLSEHLDTAGSESIMAAITRARAAPSSK
jgi:hypothetical protein